MNPRSLDLLGTFIPTRFPDMKLLGISGDGVDGIEILHVLKRKFSNTRFIVLTGKTSRHTIKLAL